MKEGILPNYSPYNLGDFEKYRDQFAQCKIDSSTLAQCRPHKDHYFPRKQIAEFFQNIGGFGYEFCDYLDALISRKGQDLSGQEIVKHLDDNEEKYFSIFMTPSHYKQALMRYMAERFRVVNFLYKPDSNQISTTRFLGKGDIRINWDHLAYTHMGSHTPTVNSDTVAQPLQGSCLLALLADGATHSSEDDAEHGHAQKHFTGHRLAKLIVEEQSKLAEGIDQEIDCQFDYSVLQRDNLSDMKSSDFLRDFANPEQNQRIHQFLQEIIPKNFKDSSLRRVYLRYHGIQLDEVNDKFYIMPSHLDGSTNKMELIQRYHGKGAGSLLTNQDLLDQDVEKFFQGIDCPEKLLSIFLRNLPLDALPDLDYENMDNETSKVIVRTLLSLFEFNQHITQCYQDQYPGLGLGPAASSLIFAVDAGKHILLVSLGDSSAYAFSHDGIIEDSLTNSSGVRTESYAGPVECFGVMDPDVPPLAKPSIRVIEKAKVLGLVLESDGMSGSYLHNEEPKYFNLQNDDLRELISSATDSKDLLKRILYKHLNIAMNSDNKDDASAVLVARVNNYQYNQNE